MRGIDKRSPGKRIFLSLFLTIMIAAGCTTIKTSVTSDPSGAKIFWGPTKSDLEWDGKVTPYEESHDVFLAEWKAGCVQVKKDGYQDSEVVCRPKEQRDRHVHFVLKPKARQVTHHITSDPPGAEIFWGFNESTMASLGPGKLTGKFKNFIDKYHFFTPVTPYEHRFEAPFGKIPPSCYQVKKEGYQDSEVICKHQGDREDLDFHFVLHPLPPRITIDDVFLCDQENPKSHVSSVRWGQKLLMVIRYTLSRVPEGAKTELTKYYRIFHQGESKFEKDFKDQKTAGTYEATLSMTVPTVMDPGEYVLNGIVRMGDQEAEKKFVFTVKE